MSEEVIELNGTMRPDGTVVLDETPNLPAGRVRVTLQPLAVPTVTWGDFWTKMQQIWAAQKASGYIPRSVEEVERERQALRDESEEEILEALRMHEACERVRCRPSPERP
jgi:hypothetical protein